MAITPSHSLWQRERLKHHSGAQRYYDDRPVPVPRGPTSSPIHCALCNCEPLSDKASGSSFFPNTFKENRIPVFLRQFTTTMALKKTLTCAAKHPSCCSANVLPSRYHQYYQLNFLFSRKIRNLSKSQYIFSQWLFTN